ncbi:phage major tail tube protein [Carnimonas bestiolae]|uniref:phage major tail tube protein n=1 Tax=Carnimonas bestiolae TaxID=3402172 RepID=UPI003EDB9BF2
MALPSKLKAMNLYGNGDNWQGQVATVTPPKLQRNMNGSLKNIIAGLSKRPELTVIQGRKQWT